MQGKWQRRLIDLLDEEVSIKFGMTLLQVPWEIQSAAVARWSAQGRQPLRALAPYFRHMYLVELFYNLAIGADLISRVRPAKRADNKIDIAYLYYVPFCRVFASSDSLHERVIPLFLREDQSFVKGSLLKADLKKLDEYFDALPGGLRGRYSFAVYPPPGEIFLVTRFSDQHSPNWRKENEKPELSPEEQKALLGLTKRLSEESKPVPAQGP